MLSLQQRILNAFSKGETLTWNQVHDCVHDVDRGALDVGLGALVRSKKLTLTGAKYSLSKAEQKTPTPNDCTASNVPPPSAEEEAAANLRPVVPAKKKARVKVSAPEPGSPQAISHPVIANHVFEHAKKRLSEALNRIEMLTVDIANQRGVVAECEQFLELYRRFEQGAG